MRKVPPIHVILLAAMGEPKSRKHPVPIPDWWTKAARDAAKDQDMIQAQIAERSRTARGRAGLRDRTRNPHNLVAPLMRAMHSHWAWDETSTSRSATGSGSLRFYASKGHVLMCAALAANTGSSRHGRLGVAPWVARRVGNAAINGMSSSRRGP